MSDDSLSTFKEKLTTGGYANIVGARRGIGKFQGMSDSDRDKARAMADKFFGEEGTPAPVAKKTEKPAPKAPAKKASKKEAVKKAPAAKTKKAPVAESKGKGASKASPKAPAAAKAAATKKPVARAVKTTDVA